MAMSAAELLLSAEPPIDDGDIERALADLDVKIWTWTDAMMSAQAALRNSYAQRPAVYPSMGQFDDADTDLTSDVPAYNPGGSGESAAPPAPGFGQPAGGGEWRPTFAPPAPASGEEPAGGTAWPTGGWSPQGAPSAEPPPAAAAGWASTGGQWQPASAKPPSQPPGWSTWSGAGSPGQAPGEPGSVAGSKKSAKHAKVAKAAPAKLQGPTPEEVAARAEAESAQLAQLDEATVRRVKLLRRLDPETPIEKLIEKALQAQQPTEAVSKDEKSSWWRRK